MRPTELLHPEQRHPSNELRKAVSAWRKEGYPNITPITKRLLQFWFNEDHPVNGEPFECWFGQREAIETLINEKAQFRKKAMSALYQKTKEAIAEKVYRTGDTDSHFFSNPISGV